MTDIQKKLFSRQDSKYADFVAKLVPTEPRESFIGVRAAEYSKILKEIGCFSEQAKIFMNEVPHQYQEENILHIQLINRLKDFEQCIFEINKFLPFVTNWAVSDGLNPKVLNKNHGKLLSHVKNWIENDKPYTKRIGMILFMKNFLGSDFDREYLEWPAKIRTDEYYVNMMTAWLFAEALAKQWNSAIKFVEQRRLDIWTHNKTIQKALESFRITPEQKEYLRNLKIKS